MPRDKIISVISLRKCLGYPTDDSQSGLLFITNFNNLDTAFHVDEVLGIHRVSWEQIHTPDSTISSGTGEAGIATGVLKMDDRLIVLLDFEKIISWINPETSLRVSDMDNYVTKDRSASPILLAEDSKLLMKLIQECLTKAGYTNLIARMVRRLGTSFVN